MKKVSQHGSMGIFYILGIIGAAMYFISLTTGFWPGVVAFLKSLVWPVFFVNELLVFVGA